MKRVTPDEAAELIEQGWKYIDVRSVPEFEQGHPSGAYNVPIVHRTPQGSAPNTAFLEVMAARFAKDEQLIVGCRSGRRAMRAIQALQDQGYTNLVKMNGGFEGETDGSGATCEGWQSRGLPVSTEAQAGRSYAELMSKKQ